MPSYDEFLLFSLINENFDILQNGEDERVIVEDVEIVDTCDDYRVGNEEYERKPVNELISFFEKLARL